MRSPRNYPRRTPRIDTEFESGTLPIKVALMRPEDAQFWHGNVQPIIRSAIQPRADRHWDWRILRRVLPLAQWMQQRRCLALATLAPNEAGNAVPVAMHLLIESYPHLPRQQIERATFLWFMSAMPKEAFAQFGIAGAPPALGRVCLDIAFVSSLHIGNEGRIGLHCAQAGGDRLLAFYSTTCKLARLAEDVARVGRRANDGRFFYTEVDMAEKLLRELDEHR